MSKNRIMGKRLLLLLLFFKKKKNQAFIYSLCRMNHVVQHFGKCF